MSNSHPWCHDVQRDVAIRAAEDAAAVPSIQHRELPSAVRELQERVVRLEAAAAPAANSGGEPRGWLTAEEREALEWFCGSLRAISREQCDQWRDAIQSLLARSTPPRVKVPPIFNAKEHNAVVAAIRAAGGEVTTNDD